MKPVSQTKKHQGTSVTEQQPLGSVLQRIYDCSCQLDCHSKKKKTEDIYVSGQENLRVVSVFNTFKPQIINWEDFREQNLDYFVIDRPPVLLSNQIKAHETICSISYLGKLESQFNRLRALYRLWRSTDLLKSLASERIKGKNAGNAFFFVCLFVL